MHIQIPSHLSDAELVDEAKRLARSERETTAHLVAHIAELGARRLYLAAGFRSLFAYCHEVLELSEQSTYNRLEAARAARRFPVILDMLSDAALTLATVRLIAPHLTADNHETLLKAASHKSKREVEKLLACLFPQPDVPDSVRKVRSASAPSPPPLPGAPERQLNDPQSREPQPIAAPGAGTSSLINSDSAATVPLAPIVTVSISTPVTSTPTGVTNMASVTAPSPLPVPPRRTVVRPLAEDRFEVRFTAPASTCEKLKLAQDLLRHAVPNGDMAEVVDRALTALLENLAKQKYAATACPRSGRSSGAGSRHIPADVRRTVWLRDLGRCTFTSTTGRRCGTRGFLEFHHVRPFAAGGPATTDNIQLRCRAHNAHEADLYFGPRGGEEGEWFPHSAASQVAPPRGVSMPVAVPAGSGRATPTAEPGQVTPTHGTEVAREVAAQLAPGQVGPGQVGPGPVGLGQVGPTRPLPTASPGPESVDRGRDVARGTEGTGRAVRGPTVLSRGA